MQDTCIQAIMSISELKSPETYPSMIILFVLIISNLSDGVIYRLNDTEYLKMPPVYHMDDYDTCVRQANGTYCYMDMTLVSDVPSELLQTIREYSEHTSTHFNNTQLHHGICLTKTCKHLLQANTLVDPKFILERCLNESLWRDYRLRTKLSDKIYCKKLHNSVTINIGDICAAIFFLCIGLLNVIGSLYDACFIKGGEGNIFLLSFSFKRNFKRLITNENSDPLRERLKGLNGMNPEKPPSVWSASKFIHQTQHNHKEILFAWRTPHPTFPCEWMNPQFSSVPITTSNTDDNALFTQNIKLFRTLSIVLVIFAHSPLPLVASSVNPHEVELVFYIILCQLYFNGTLIVQTFFVITGCLMAYNTRDYMENNNTSWIFIPKGIIMRWIRLTPPYAVVLIFTVTWIRFIATGPLWETIVGVEVEDCQRYGWLNIMFLNNYVDGSQCMIQTWFLAANMQLYILGLFVFILANTSRRRSYMLWTLFIVGFIIPPIHTYLQDLDAVLLMSPESARNFFLTDPTFNHSYKRSHTNIPGFVLGLLIGNLIYTGFRDEKKIQKYKKLGIVYYLTVPMVVAVLLSGMVFYEDRPRPPVYIRTALSAIFRPLFALLVAIFILGMVFKFENVYRRVLEWDGWRTLSRVSYCAFLVHATIIRVFAGMNTTLLRSGLAQCAKEGAAIIFISFLIAYPFWLFVEAPLTKAMLAVLGLSSEVKKETNLKIESIERQTPRDTTRV